MTKNGDLREWHRRRFLRSLAWAGAGALWTARDGVSQGMSIDRAAQEAQPTQVVVDNFSFAPPTISVPVGATVRWTNRDDIPHNVVSTEQAFKSPVLDTDESFTHTFGVAGTFKYYCSIHPRMTGQVVVR